jgi:hypothetical protein
MRLLLSFISICLSLYLSAQENNKWELLQEKDGVKMYSKLSHCVIPSEGTNDDYYLFKIENTNNFSATVNWKIDAWYNGKCYSCSGNEDPIHQFELPANQNIEGVCDMYKTNSLKVYVKNNQFPSKAKFSKFTLSTFSVKPAL